MHVLNDDGSFVRVEDMFFRAINHRYSSHEVRLSRQHLYICFQRDQVRQSRPEEAIQLSTQKKCKEGPDTKRLPRAKQGDRDSWLRSVCIARREPTLVRCRRAIDGARRAQLVRLEQQYQGPSLPKLSINRAILCRAATHCLKIRHGLQEV